jgi:2-polyprenyl-6-hydroxyphenyl methylase/3-demethylubiquinone-9 3-methyltransferase
LHACDLRPSIQPGEGPGQVPGLEVRTLDLDAHGLAAYEDGSFELVVCSDVIEHLENPARLLREISRVLRPEGELFLSFPNAFNRFERLHVLHTGNSSRYPRSKPSQRGHISVLPLPVLETLGDRAGLALIEEGRGYCYLHGHFWFPERSFTHVDSYVCNYRLRKLPGSGS